MRGGVPTFLAPIFHVIPLSPHAWGCTGLESVSLDQWKIVPTCVGVYLWRIEFQEGNPDCPHMRGGVPLVFRINLYNLRLSPHAWGCTVSETSAKINQEIVPTCVGVYRDGKETLC